MSESQLVAKRDRLAARLHDGERRIQEAERQGKDVFAWEDFWLGLLKEYEAIYNAIGNAGRRERPS